MERRVENRLNTYAKIILIKQNKPGYLININKHGCKISLVENLKFDSNEILNIQIHPEFELGMPAFEIEIIVKWTKWDGIYLDIGGHVNKVPEKYKSVFNKLVAYFYSI